MEPSPEKTTSPSLEGLPMESLIGGPLNAAAQAQAAAAEAQIKFLETISGKENAAKPAEEQNNTDNKSTDKK